LTETAALGDFCFKAPCINSLIYLRVNDARSATVADLLVNVSELPSPQDVVEKLSMIKAIVVRTVALCVVCWGQYRHLVAID